MATERLVVDHDPPEKGYGPEVDVALSLEVPPRAQSNGWGEIPKGRRR